MVEHRDARSRVGQLLYLLLAFTEKNPGITRVLLGDALIGERERLLTRVEHFFSRLETQLRQILREGEAREVELPVSVEVAANLMLVTAEGCMHQYLRSRFRHSPLGLWEEQWGLLANSLFGGRNPS
jgi:TetR/AcrR family transcriptional regulator